MDVAPKKPGLYATLYFIIYQVHQIAITNYTGQQPKCFRNKLGRSQLMLGR